MQKATAGYESKSQLSVRVGIRILKKSGQVREKSLFRGADYMIND